MSQPSDINGAIDVAVAGTEATLGRGLTSSMVQVDGEVTLMASPPAPSQAGEITVGQLAARSGVAVSALHFYEARGLISSRRTAGNQRRYPRVTLRRVAFIRASQRVGIPLSRIKVALDTLPAGRTPTPRDWARLSAAWRQDLDDRIAQLQDLRDRLTDCIGCGCLSMDTCLLANPDDALAAEGTGPRRLHI